MIRLRKISILNNGFRNISTITNGGGSGGSIKSHCQYQTRSFSSSLKSTSSSSLSMWWEPSYKETHQNKIDALPELKSVENLQEFLKKNGGGGGGTTRDMMTTLLEAPTGGGGGVQGQKNNYKHTLDKSQYMLSLDAAMAVYSLHIHSRIAAMVGKGYYTIGPCGEELLSSAGIALQSPDSTALHYRHTGISLIRQLLDGNSNNNNNKHDDVDDSLLQDILLARARGYTVSKYDPVTGGVHCSIGGGPNEYLVTSTLSSQCPSAVGRALGYSLLRNQHQQQQDITGNSSNNGNDDRPISFCTIGDGSLHNHHFLSSYTLARHAKHLGIKCPMVFGISNNGLSISYETKDYIKTVFGHDNNDPLIPIFVANGQDMMDVYDQTKQACDYSRRYQSPTVLIYENLVRRFGHAATDRQLAYLSQQQIDSMAYDTCVLQNAFNQAVEVLNYTTYEELLARWEQIHYQYTNHAFEQAITEPKVTLEDMMDRVVPPLVPVNYSNTDNNNNESSSNISKEKSVSAVEKISPDVDGVRKNNNSNSNNNEKPQVLRKHMTRVFQEVMENDPSIIYLGEDVRHGGYYLVTEGLVDKFGPNRVLDFPPDETTLLGAGLGFSQLGLVPIVEIPYAKYLDCGVDLFYEIAIQHWLGSGGIQSRKNGMVIRLQGFDRGVFGGNFHTHNSLAHVPPGIDVVCYSNGDDYVKGMRHAIHQAKYAGRIVMVVDCTHLLNLRHVFENKDRGWEFPYPVLGGDPEEDFLEFDTVHRYSAGKDANENAANTAIVSYGNGIVTSLQARKRLVERNVLSSPSQLDVIDCPYLNDVPDSLEETLKDYDQVLFADICKEGPGSNVFSSMITTLQQRNALPSDWMFVGAPRTYNPLGSTVTFLNSSTIEEAVEKLTIRKQ